MLEACAEVTKRSRDGGIDINLLKKSEVGTLLTLTQCKRYAPEKKVAVDVVRQLYGIVESGKATSGLMVATSTLAYRLLWWAANGHLHEQDVVPMNYFEG